MQLVKFLGCHTRLTVVYLGVGLEVDARLIEEQHVPGGLVFLDPAKPLDLPAYGTLLAAFLEAHEPDACIFEYIHLSGLLRFVPGTVTTVLDTHDIVHERTRSFQAFNSRSAYDISEKLEYDVYALYDYVMLICEQDYRQVAERIGRSKALLTPHPVAVKQRVIRREAATIGFVASDYAPNVDAIRYFIEEVWPQVLVRHAQVKLHVYGFVADAIGDATDARIVKKGFVKNLGAAYDELDIVINPVRYGAGLKIKNVEALGNGLPLVTTSHGARGLDQGTNTAFLVADEPAAFSECLIELLSSYEQRKSLGDRAFGFAKEHFSPNACFGELVAVLRPREEKAPDGHPGSTSRLAPVDSRQG